MLRRSDVCGCKHGMFGRLRCLAGQRQVRIFDHGRHGGHGIEGWGYCHRGEGGGFWAAEDAELKDGVKVTGAVEAGEVDATWRCPVGSVGWRVQVSWAWGAAGM
jgi:hypothetical protein